eukprot:817707-Prorocentrum_minimum.AAC.1
MRALGRKRAVVQEESRPGTLNIAHWATVSDLASSALLNRSEACRLLPEARVGRRTVCRRLVVRLELQAGRIQAMPNGQPDSNLGHDSSSPQGMLREQYYEVEPSRRFTRKATSTTEVYGQCGKYNEASNVKEVATLVWNNRERLVGSDHFTEDGQ